MVDEMNTTQSYEFAESIINTVREPLISLDQDLRVVTANRSFYEFFKVKPEETVGQLIYDLGDGQWDIPKLRELLENILPQKTILNDYEVEHDFATIGRHVMLLNARQIIREMGKERIILLAFEDITEHKRLENQLVASEERYRRLFENAHDGVLLLEKRDMTIHQANPAITTMLGYSCNDCVGKEMKDIGFLRDIGTCQEILQTLNRDGILYHQNYPVHTKTGNVVDTDIYMVDKASLIQCNIRDITEQKQAEEDLRASEEKFRTIADHIHNWEYWTGQDGNLIYVSPSCKRITSYTDTEFYQDPELLTRIIHPDDFENFMRHVEAVNETGTSWDWQECSFRILTRDGKTRWIGHNCQKVFNLEGKSLGRRVSNRDISDQKTAEQEREKMQAQFIQAQKMESVGQLAGGVAHDFNNMLSVILGYGNIILETIPLDDPLHECAQEIVNAGIRSASITRQLLAFARKQTIAPQVLDLNETIEEMLKMLRRLIGEDIDLNWQPSSVWPIYFDPSQLDQIMANLCVNARDAIDGVGKVTIETETTTFDETYCSQHLGFIPGEFALLSISDNGIGMDSDTVSRIFEPFFTTKEMGKGTGLGLATVYGIVKQNNGFINVYSEIGHGTTFRIYLPRQTEQITASEKKKEDVILHGRGEIILVVEDEAPILKLTSRMLTGLGYTVITANSPSEALILAKEHGKAIDLLITDVIMPELNGRDLADRLLSLHPNLKCLFMSGYTSTVIARHGVLEKGKHFIQKPFSARGLGAKVNEVLKSDLGNVS